MIIIPKGIDIEHDFANIYLIRYKGVPIYVGKTCRDINIRFSEHCNKNCATHIHKFIEEKGVGKFSIELIEVVNYSEWEEKEDYWINYYNTMEEGLNHQGGGKCNPMDYEKSRENFYRAVKSERFREIQRQNGFNQSEEIRNKIGNSCKEWYSHKENKESFKELMTEMNGRDIALLDNNDEVVRIFPSIVKAAEYIGKSSSQAQNIGRAASRYDSGKTDSKSYGYRWSFKKCRD